MNVPMLPPFIIDQIRRREDEERRRHEAERPRLELPLDVHEPPVCDDDNSENDQDRGVIILEL